MPWYNGDYPPSYKNQPSPLNEKAVEIANHILIEGTEEGIAIATGLKRACEFFAEQKTRNKGGGKKSPLPNADPRTQRHSAVIKLHHICFYTPHRDRAFNPQRDVVGIIANPYGHFLPRFKKSAPDE